MNHQDTLIENLKRYSTRLNKGLLIFLGLTLLLIAISYWSSHKLLEEQHGRFKAHFARMMEDIREHEDFLRGVAVQSSKIPLHANDSVSYLKSALPEEGPHNYLGQEFAFSTPFSLSVNHQSVEPDTLARLADLGEHLTDYYSAFWSTSHYQSPPFFLFDAVGNFNIGIPAAGHSRDPLWKNDTPNKTLVLQTLKHLLAKDSARADGVVDWQPLVPHQANEAPVRLLAYVSTHLGPQWSRVQDSGKQIGVASLFSMDLVNDIKRLMPWSTYDHVALVAPSGKVLSGSLQPGVVLHDGLNITSDGMVFKVSSHSAEPWSALYTIGFKSYFNYTLWPLPVLLALLIGGIGCGWLVSRRYQSRIVKPVYEAYQRTAESEAFSRAVIDSAPTGLCVVRRSDFKVLLENRKAQQWQGSTKLRMALESRQDLCVAGETRLDIDGTHLQVGFVPTRYQGEDALLCAFHDVTSHIEGAAMLEQARRSADAASEAKTLFLATMSHEIRTPLYGVLGTLELLGLTRLDARQREHLQTIQRSSSTLFQLISDVLDISKIESGQMAIESQAFCPLQMIEDTLHAYSVFAENKGLLLYACVDAALPDQLLGDPVRIRQILSNLLSNAIKFTDTGRVVLRVKLLHCVDGQASLEWQVTDSGIGISPAQQERLFDTFYQVRDASSEAGAGLGLAICRCLTEMMDGQIRVVSEPGLGSSFSLRLGLKVMPGALEGCADILPSTQAVYVRAPAVELAQSTSDWLNRLGVVAKPLPAFVEESRQANLLVDVQPSDSLPAWAGPRVLCVAGEHPAPPPRGCTVDAHDVRAIARAVSLTLHGKTIAPAAPECDLSSRLGLHILVAEDNAINQAIIKEQLEALGCTVTAASNGEEALQLWQPQVFDLVLTDVNMPLLNGYELTRALRERDRETPIVGVTANAMREEGARCMAVGMNAWLVKPLSLQTLHQYLSNLCANAPAQEPQPMIDATPSPATGDTMIELSPKMRELFITTMRQDVQSVTDALDAQDPKRLAERLHSAAGALGAVQLSGLAKNCAELESRILQSAITSSVTLEVKSLIQSLTDILNALE
ncbi:hybrid sensor histidine kinase/response regulator [Pseudomonas chlororaphis]|uniref:hybrid sensor histidine kinase/response regulator n=1 Tax=Pseudomonas chlororaphis TaxID=587753 RepID=UPI002365B064|nr:hybrid sensor histidine kinase/response regulator [Pseudomonas chlororaphis]WDG53154.1 response regulator [Pseudomonas chlororaphis]WDH85824.1 response regulator [Pseudomonas chlororaphis]